MTTRIALSVALLAMLTAYLPPNGSRSGIHAVKPEQNIELFVPADLEATLWAESPMFYNPTNMDVDVRGRIWVTEAVNYRNFNNDSTKHLHHQSGDRVMILEDTDGDGKADKSKVFVEDRDLVSPVGIAVIGNKVLVSCAPNLLIYTDENGDDVPDKKEIFLTGFGGRDHDHSLHAVYAGPDGNWYFNAGNAGPHRVKDKAGWTLRAGSLYTGGSPYNKENEGNQKSDDGRVWVGGVALRIKPDGTGLKVMGHNFRNSYEVIPDSYGNLWQNDNDDQVVTCRTSWLMEGGNAGYFSADGTRFWQADQRPGQGIFNAHWHQDDPGVMPAGDCSGAGAPTGITINEGDALGKKYVGLLLSADAGRNVVFGYTPQLDRSGFDLGRRSNFISSLSEDNPGYVWNDSAQNLRREKWFRPSDVTIGTDGAIYVADWYDPVVGGHQMKDPTGYGRIYRITPKNKRLQAPVIDLSTLDGQLQAFKSPAINVRNLGFQKLVEQGAAALVPVKQLLADENRFVRARAAWILPKLGQGGKAELEKLLDGRDLQLRAVAYRALRESSDDILPYASKMAADSSAFVRREVAISLRDLPFEKTKGILLDLVKKYDGRDRWYLESLGTSLAGHESEIYPVLLETLAGNKPAPQWNKKMSMLAWRLHPIEAVKDLTARATAASLPASERQAAITSLSFINHKSAADAMVILSKNKLPDVAGQAAYWLSFRQGNDWYTLLDWSKINVNTRYERTLAQMKVNKEVMQDATQPPDERRRRAEKMAMDSVGGQLLVGMAAEKKIPASLMPYIEKKIFKNPDPSVRGQAAKYFKNEGVVAKFLAADIMKLKPDEIKGKAIFAGQCAACHKANGVGNTIGPELSGIGKKFDKPDILEAIINPSASIVFGYEPWLVNTKDGTSVYGFLVSDNKDIMVLRDISGKKHLIPASKISSRQKQEKSLMPDAANTGLTAQNLADLAAYLQKLKG